MFCLLREFLISGSDMRIFSGKQCLQFMLSFEYERLRIDGSASGVLLGFLFVGVLNNMMRFLAFFTHFVDFFVAIFKST